MRRLGLDHDTAAMHGIGRITVAATGPVFSPVSQDSVGLEIRKVTTRP
jgi:hypothetical protein